MKNTLQFQKAFKLKRKTMKKQIHNLRMVLAISCFIAGTWLGYQGNITAFIVCYTGVIWFTPFGKTTPVIAFKALLTILLAVLGANYRLTAHTGDHSTLTVCYIDVGQGDSTLLELPDGTVVLIDAGSAESVEHVIHKLRSEGIHTIDYLIGTHPHIDHIGGIPAVLDEFQVKSYLQPEIGSYQVENSYTMELLARKLNQYRIPVQNMSAGMVLYDNNSCRLEVLAPKPEIIMEDLNDYSMILKLSYYNISFLFMADAGYLEEETILNDAVDCDVLKIGHHGSYGSTSNAFLKQTDPRYAVISVGRENEHHLPNTSVLEKLDVQSIPVYRTDEDGTITVLTDGNGIQIKTEN